MAKKKRRRRRPSLSQMQYQKYLKTSYWRGLRKRLLVVKCAGCLCEDASVLHHTTYGTRGNEGPEDIIPLCRDCHTLLHEYLDWRYNGIPIYLAVMETEPAWASVFSDIPLREVLRKIGWYELFDQQATIAV